MAEASTQDLKHPWDPPDRVELVPRGLIARAGRGGCGCRWSARLRRKRCASRRLEDAGTSRLDFWAAVIDSVGDVWSSGAWRSHFWISLLQVEIRVDAGADQKAGSVLTLDFAL